MAACGTSRDECRGARQSFGRRLRVLELGEGVVVAAGVEVIPCREHLAGYKIPRTIVFEELPKTSTGKVQKFVLRERAKGM
jgi:acyl-CoA synthetase (AMP-forming)/AMP-acid ligase II